MILLKKLVSILLFLFLAVTCTHAAPTISEDFYLKNGELSPKDVVGVMRILPNTLRLTLFEGESSEIYADVFPENATEAELQWSLPDNAGKVDIYPRGVWCTVCAVSEGEENIRITARDGVSANVAVQVKKPQQIRTRTFDYQGEEEKTEVFTDTVMRFIIRFLITLAAALLFAVVILGVKQRGWKKK